LDILPQVASDSDGFYYNLSAFLTAWRSTLDVMLYDLAEHFSLGFTREDEMRAGDFETAARALNRTEALRFISWWKQKQGILSNTPLWKKRNFNLHRGSLSLRLQTYSVGASGSGETLGTVSIWPIPANPTYSSSLGPLIPSAITYVDASHTSTTVSSNASTTVSSNASTTISVGPVTLIQEWHFDDLPDERVIDICEKAYDKMRQIIEEAETAFTIQL
jgi:hypothetical protein